MQEMAAPIFRPHYSISEMLQRPSLLPSLFSGIPPPPPLLPTGIFESKEEVGKKEMVGKKRGHTTKEGAKKVKKTDVIEVGESDEDETGRVKAVEGLGLSRKLLCPPPPKQGRLLPQGHSGFRDFRMPRAREESNPAPSQTKPSLPHSPTTTLIHFIRHCFHLQRSYTSPT